MHGDSYTWMDQLLQRAPTGNLHVLDVGARDVNGTYRPMCEARGWKYIGLDIERGANVDVVSADPSHYPLESRTFDVVLTGQMLEHCERPWLVVPEMARLLKPGGLLAIVTVWKMFLHDYPRDVWRFMPDAFRVLFDEANCLKEYYAEMKSDNGISGDVAASAIKS